MRRLGKLVLCCVLVVVMGMCSAFAEMNFDISVFENDERFSVEFDDMDDTGEITLAEDGLYFFGLADEEDAGALILELDVKIVNDLPPVLRLTTLYLAEDWVFGDKFIIKAGENRYTFEIDRETEVLDGGNIAEMFTIAFTNESMKLLEDCIANPESVRFRYDGDSEINGSIPLTQVTVDNMKLLYDTYVASVATDNDFSIIGELYPCEIK